MGFQIDFPALLFCVLAGIVAYLGWQKRDRCLPPHFNFSFLKGWNKNNLGWKKFFLPLPQQLFFASLALLLGAFIDPRITGGKEGGAREERNATEGIAIYFVLDQSGSMAEQGGRRTSKMELLKKVTEEFIRGSPAEGLKGRPNDLLGIVSFARGANVLSPLTLDHATILKQLASLDVVKDRAQDGTSIGYALYKTANLIAAAKQYATELSEKGKPAYTIKSNVIILVTDGLQDPNPLDKGKRLRNIDLQEAALFAKENDIRLYAILIEPKLATEEYAPYRRLMERITSMTGGKFFMISNTSSLSQIYKEIDQLEKSSLPDLFYAQPKRQFSFFPYLISLALLCAFAGVAIKTLILRESP